MWPGEVQLQDRGKDESSCGWARGGQRGVRGLFSQWDGAGVWVPWSGETCMCEGPEGGEKGAWERKRGEAGRPREKCVGMCIF